MPQLDRYMHKIEHLNKIAEKIEKLDFLKLARNELYFFFRKSIKSIEFWSTRECKWIEVFKSGLI